MGQRNIVLGFAFASLSIAMVSMPIDSAAATISKHSLPSTVPKPWRAAVKGACATYPRDHEYAGIYFSNYVDGFFKLLLLNTQGEFSLMYWSIYKDSFHRRRYAGQYRFAGGLVALDFSSITTTVSRDEDDAALLVVNHDKARYLLQEGRLEGIGRSIHWNGYFGAADEYFVKVQCDGPLPDGDERGQKSPPRAQLPMPLRQFVIEQPIVATITSVNGLNDEDEYIVVVDKGKDAKLDINMPLCSPKESGKHWMGWVLDASAPNQAQVRVIEWGSTKSTKVPSVGDTLTSVEQRCFLRKR